MDAIYGKDMFGEAIKPPSRGKIADDFTLPPFSVLNAREGFWQDRKRAWIALGIKSEVGRGGQPGLTMSPMIQELKPSADQAAKRANGGCGDNGKPLTWHTDDLGKNLNGYRDAKKQDYAKTYNSGAPGALAAQFAAKAAPGGGARPACDYSNRERGSGSAIAGTSANGDDAEAPSENGSGTSIFDPVLCELAYRWFSPVGGQIVDPFAGGSVRGIVAHMLGRKYWGCDLRPEQIAANEAQANEITPDDKPAWVCGDAVQVVDDAPQADLIFSCPPYGNLEVYSDDPLDLSTMPHDEFVVAYRKIIGKACGRLKLNRFACFVVGDYRDDKGNYRNFVAETIAAFELYGLKLYNEAVLVTAVGSLPIRIGKQFRASRKLGKTHQNVLVFVKGDGKKAAEACGEL